MTKGHLSRLAVALRWTGSGETGAAPRDGCTKDPSLRAAGAVGPNQPLLQSRVGDYGIDQPGASTPNDPNIRSQRQIREPVRQLAKTACALESVAPQTTHELFVGPSVDMLMTLCASSPCVALQPGNLPASCLSSFRQLATLASSLVRPKSHRFLDDDTSQRPFAPWLSFAHKPRCGRPVYSPRRET